jgi:lysozyme
MMTIYGWDASHFDGVITQAVADTAVAQGIQFFTHKLGEGASHADDDSTAAASLAHMKAAGVEVLGGYWFCHGDSSATAQADLFVATADELVPWWRDFPHWCWQPDCESETGHPKPSASWIKTFADRLVSKTNRLAIVYASHGQYGDSLQGLGHPLWNANYPSSRQAPFKSLYPGDGYAGWAEYSGQTPVLCQYASSATIAGKTTCDANAYRGTIEQLKAFVGGDDMTPAEMTAAVAAGVKEAMADPKTGKALMASFLACDEVPAPQPPYENADYYGTPATGGKPAVPGNTLWSVGSWLRIMMQHVRGQPYIPPTNRPVT